jgi:hypothetical protein
MIVINDLKFHKQSPHKCTGSSVASLREIMKDDKLQKETSIFLEPSSASYE